MNDIEDDIKAVKELGEKMGYGHLMELASALWRRYLKETGVPEFAAFVPTITTFVKKKYRRITEESAAVYDELIKQAK